MNDNDLLGLLHETVDAIAAALSTHDDWGLVGGARDDEYKHDVVADAAALAVLTKAPVGILSEESGITDFERDVIVVLDPVDGSTNASHGLPWFATSICAVGDDGPRAAVVINHVTKQRFAALRGGGATLNGNPIRPTAATELAHSIVALSGMPSQGNLGWRQFRALGASALDMCAVAAGMLDAFLDCTPQPAHGPWDYLGGLLICQEAGAVVTDRYGDDLLVLEHTARRSPVAAATPALLEDCIKKLNN
jgi:fructose-1,6-bisphosphatase/inositol monophosphatase family enzyme